MNTNGSIRALRRANPRAKAGFAESVEATADALRAQIVTTAADAAMEAGRTRAGPRASRPAASSRARLDGRHAGSRPPPPWPSS